MASTTIGVKVDDATRERLKALAEAKDRSPHWMIKRALMEFLDREEKREQERRDDETGAGQSAARFDTHIHRDSIGGQ